MWDRMNKEEDIRKMFRKVDSREVGHREEIIWNEKGVEDWFRKVKSFKEELFVLVHLTGGASARGTEIISIQHENGKDSRAQRGIFIDKGFIQFVTSYHKGYSASQQVKIIHRYIPKEVGKLVVYYLWLIEPFVQMLQIMVKKQSDFSSFIWEPEPEEEWIDEGEEEEEEEENIEEEVEVESTGKNIIRRNQSTKKAMNIDGFWGTDRVRRAIVKETESRIGVKITTAVWRQVYPAIQRRFAKDKSITESLDSIYNSGMAAAKEDEQDYREKQSGHSKRMEQMIYGVLLSESPFYTESEKDGFRKVSLDWHRFLHFESAWDEENTNPDIKARIEHDQEEEEFRRWKRIRESNPEQQLRKLLGKKAIFRGVQKDGLAAIMAKVPRVLVIMRTGGGKSLFFMIPALCSKEGVTIVVVPLSSLREDLQQRCTKVGISCTAWKGTRPSYWSSIVLVTPESAVTKAFARFINEKKMMRQLDRIVIDECHVVLDSTKEWRPEIRKLVEMTEKGTQVVYLTATLPPKNEAEFYDAVGVKEGEMTKFRDRTTRTNVAYKVVEYEKEEADEEVKRIVEEKLREYAAPGQIVVYCKTIKQTQRLAGVLGCSAYYREVGTEEEKRRILEGLTSGRERVFTATNALGLGIDAASIRVVIHVGLKDKMREYAQESGRAGRDGLKSEAITLRGYWVGRDGKRKVEKGWKMEASMKDSIEGKECRRVVLDKEMDGRSDRRGCEVEEEKCDVCDSKVRGRKRRWVEVEGAREDEERFLNREVEAPREFEVTSRRRVEEERIRGEFEVGEEERSSEYSDIDDITFNDSGVVVEEREEDLRGEEEVLRREFEEQKRLEEARRWVRIEEKIRDGIEVEKYVELLDAWQGVCVICKAKERPGDRGHHWRECDCRESERRFFEGVLRIIEQIKFERYSGCSFCRVPQKVCHLWEEDKVRGPIMFKRRMGGKCQYEGVLLPIAAAIQAFRWNRDSSMQLWLEREQEEVNYEGSHPNEDIGEKEKRWFGKKVVLHGIETSQLNKMVYVFG